MPRFVILAHDWPTPHFDFLLEEGDACLTWRLPSDVFAHEMAIERLPDHRLLYLDYEGPVSGNRGTVTRKTTGTFEWRERRESTIRVALTTKEWQGEIELTDTRWRLIFPAGNR